jgi:phosphotransferase system HPr (HPr) family protein
VSELEVQIVNRLGLHARAAARLVHAANGFRSAITVTKGASKVDGKSILGLLTLAAVHPTDRFLDHPSRVVDLVVPADRDRPQPLHRSDNRLDRLDEIFCETAVGHDEHTQHRWLLRSLTFDVRGYSLPTSR